MSMTIAEAAIYLNESEDNIRLMLMNAYPDTFDTLTELSDEQVQLIEQVMDFQKINCSKKTRDRLFSRMIIIKGEKAVADGNRFLPSLKEA